MAVVEGSHGGGRQVGRVISVQVFRPQSYGNSISKGHFNVLSIFFKNWSFYRARHVSKLSIMIGNNGTPYICEAVESDVSSKPKCAGRRSSEKRLAAFKQIPLKVSSMGRAAR